MKEEFLETEVLINSVRLRTLGQLFIVLGEGLIGLSSVMVNEEDCSRFRSTEDDRYLLNSNNPTS